MTPEQDSIPPDVPVAEAKGGGFKLSLDWWAVIVALLLTALVLIGVIPNVAW